MDVLRDEGEAFARKLDRADVDVTRYIGHASMSRPPATTA
jgi:hypothetical protein